jgi:hypothetical protein
MESKEDKFKQMVTGLVLYVAGAGIGLWLGGKTKLFFDSLAL